MYVTAFCCRGGCEEVLCRSQVVTPLVLVEETHVFKLRNMCYLELGATSIALDIPLGSGL